MAEFQEVMRQLNRMCLHYPNCEDNGCPIFGECGNIGSHSSNAKQAIRIEERVMSWAAEHPEPVYETWLEFIKRFETGGRKSDDDFIYWMGTTSIPADIAEKLGIKPKR